MDWVAKIDELKELLELKTDAEVGVALGLSRTMMSMVRTGRAELPAIAKFTLLDKLGYAKTRAGVIRVMGQVLPSEFAAKLIQADNERYRQKLSELPKLRGMIRKLLGEGVSVQEIEAVVDDELGLRED
jgi:hypothetical protein